MIFSDEDTDVKALVSSWLSSQPDSEQQILSGWIEDYFYKAVEWVLKKVSSSHYFVKLKLCKDHNWFEFCLSV